ncbi:MAG TPA: hypothetical protein VGC79_08620 [Polyangiaceae bacterium]
MNELTGLERAIVELVARENWGEFRTDALHVLKRENTGAGRYTYLADGYEQALPDGSYSSQGRMIELLDVRNGLGFVVDVANSRISHIELFTFGNDEWDGSESGWKIV